MQGAIGTQYHEATGCAQRDRRTNIWLRFPHGDLRDVGPAGRDYAEVVIAGRHVTCSLRIHRKCWRG